MPPYPVFLIYTGNHGEARGSTSQTGGGRGLQYSRAYYGIVSLTLERRGLMVFDLDGTLVDSVLDITLAINMTLATRDLPPLTRGEISPLIGLPASAIFESIGMSNSDELVAEFREHLGRLAGSHSIVFPGVEATLRLLGEQGWWLAVATNKPRALAEIVLERIGLKSNFDAILGSDGLAPKPEPQIVAECMRRLPNRESWMVGDTTMDIVAGRAAGAHTVAICAGSHSRDQLLKEKPDRIFPTFLAFAVALGAHVDI